MIHEQHIKELKNQLITKLSYLDETRENIWRLQFSDFEDLARTIDQYDNNYGEVYDLLSELANLLTRYYIIQGMDDLEADAKAHDDLTDLSDRVNYHLREVKYFRQEKD